MMRHELYRARRRGLNLGRENMSRITANEVFTGLVVMATATRPAVRHSPRVWSDKWNNVVSWVSSTRDTVLIMYCRD